MKARIVGWLERGRALANARPTEGASSPQAGRSAFDHALVAMALAVALYVVAMLIPAYGKLWSHPDMAIQFWPAALRHGVAPSWRDLRNSLDFVAFDAFPRARFLSHLGMIVNLKLRLYLFQWVPPHPSLSWTWAPTLLLMPWLLHRAVERLTASRRTADIATLLAVASTGNLSGVSMLFYPAKPLTTVTFAAGLYLAARATTAPDGAPRPISWRVAAQLSAVITVSFWLDEIAFFTPVAVALLVPALFTRSGRPLRALALLFVVPFGVFAISTKLVPSVNGVRFDFWNYALPRGQPSGTLTGEGVVRAGWNLLGAHLAPRGAAWPGIAFTAAIAAFLVAGARRLDGALREFATRALLAALLFVWFQARVMTRHPVPLDTYYYGCVFPVFWSLCAAPALTAASHKLPRATAVALAAMLVVALYNFEAINRVWIDRHAYHADRPQAFHFPEVWKTTHARAPLTPALVRELWQHRREPGYLETNVGRLPADSIGVWYDLTHLR